MAPKPKPTTSKPRPNLGVVCPLRCGQCCDYWRDVERLVREAGGVDAAYRQGVCHNLGRAGCKLPRAERPVECTMYRCDTVQALMAGDLTWDEAKWRKERGR